MNLNLKTKDEEKINVGFVIYKSDKEALDALADRLGISTSMILRSVTNDILEGKIVI